ncbi:MAG TPA: PDZ domain-containing protein [Pyrinomonadaceae bacterium]|nr:PDZ domain-containing protein [Pyrinomonadaceae bacterium]
MIRKLSAFILLSISVSVVAYGQQPIETDGRVAGSAARIILTDSFGGGYLGVQTLEVTKENFAEYGLSEVRGVAVESVAKDSPAAKAGLRKGDVILKFNGEEVTGVFKLTRLLREIAPDHRAKIIISRGGAESEYTVTPGKRPMPEFPEGVFGAQNFPPPRAPNFPRPPMSPDGVFQLPDDPNPLLSRRRRSSRQIGVNVTNLTEQLGEYFGVANGKGLLVNKVGANSSAAKAGIQAGDVIVEADGKTVENNLELLRALDGKKDGDIILTIVRNKNRQTVTVTPEISKDAPASFGGFGAPMPNR